MLITIILGFIVLILAAFSYFKVVSNLIKRIEKKKIKIIINASSVMIAYILILIIFGLLAKGEMGSLYAGFGVTFFGFYTFVDTTLSIIKEGFPVSLKNVTEEVFWKDVVTGLLVYLSAIWLTHYYIFKLGSRKKQIILIVLVNLIIILSYLLFESFLFAFASI